MPTKRSKLQLILEAIDKNLSATLKRVGGGLDELSTKGSATQKAMRNTGMALSALGAGGAAFIFSATRLAARVETLGVVVNQLGTTAGYSKEQLDGFETSIKGQGITLQKTRQSMAMMMQTQIDLTHGTKLAALAQNTAVIANLDSSESFQRLIAVIQTGNIRMGRTLGLQLQFGQAQKRLAKSLGITTDELTDQQVIQSRLNEVLRAGVPIMGTYDAAMSTAGKKVLSLSRHVEESRRIIGEAYLPMFADVVDGITNMLKKFEAMNAGQQRGIATAMGMGTAWAGLAGAGLILASQLTAIAANMKIAGLAFSTSLGPITLIVGAVALLTTAVISQTAANKAARTEFKRGEKEIKKSETTYKAYIREVKELAEENALTTITQEELNRMIEDGNPAAKKFAQGVVLITEAEYELELQAWRLHQIMLGEQSDWAQMAELYDSAGNRLKTVTKQTADFTEVLIDEATAANKARDANKKFLDGIGKDIESPIASFIQDIEWFLATGRQFEDAYARIQALAKDAPEEALGLAQELYVILVDTQEELDMTTGDQAAQNIADTLGIELEEAWERIAGTDGVQEAMAGLGDVYIDLGELERMEAMTLRILTNLNLFRTAGIGVGAAGEGFPVTPSPFPGVDTGLPGPTAPAAPHPGGAGQQLSRSPGDMTVNVYVDEIAQEMDVYEMAYTVGDIAQRQRR